MTEETAVLIAPASYATSRTEASAPARRCATATFAFDPNLGAADRFLRMMLGLVAMAQAVRSLESLWAVLGVGLLATGLVGRCPVYPIFGWSTRRSPI